MRKLTRFAYFLMMENPKNGTENRNINSVLILLQCNVAKMQIFHEKCPNFLISMFLTI